MLSSGTDPDEERTRVLHRMKYFKQSFVYWFTIVIIFLFYHFYFVFLLPEINFGYLIYLDILILTIMSGLFLFTFCKYRKKEKNKQEYLKSSEIIAPDLTEFENIDIALHDHALYQAYLQQEYDRNQDLQDYIARWCHEIKLPLSAAMLMNEDIRNEGLQEQLEKMNNQLNTALLGCKVQSQIYDIQIKKVDLSECVKTAIKNNRYFLIKNHFSITIDIHDSDVYSDKEWMVYVLDQMIANAIKYAKEKPSLKIWTETADQSVHLYIKDFGEGIGDADLPRIFERGYTGSNYHNGEYKSTGMGLYMVKQIVDRLGHFISVKSRVDEYTCFCIHFSNNESYFRF